MKTLLCTFVLASTLLGTFSPTQAAPPAPQEEKAPRRAPGLPFRGKISAVDLEARTLSLAGKTIRVFKVNEETKIKRGEDSATLQDLKVGDSVGGYALRAEEGATPLVVTLNIKVPEPEE